MRIQLASHLIEFDDKVLPFIGLAIYIIPLSFYVYQA